jgi:hypothetical protein
VSALAKFPANRLKNIRPPTVADTEHAWQRLNKTVVKVHAYPGNKLFRDSVIKALNVANIDERVKHISEVIKKLGPLSVLPQFLQI